MLSPGQPDLVDANGSNSISGNWKKIVAAIVLFVLIGGLVLGFMYLYYPVYLLGSVLVLVLPGNGHNQLDDYSAMY